MIGIIFIVILGLLSAIILRNKYPNKYCYTFRYNFHTQNITGIDHVVNYNYITVDFLAIANFIIISIFIYFAM